MTKNLKSNRIKHIYQYSHVQVIGTPASINAKDPAHTVAMELEPKKINTGKSMTLIKKNILKK